MRRLIWLAIILLAPAFARAANYPISAGASTATIQSTINTAAAASGGNSVTFAAGSYSITSQVTIPCPASALTIQGPTPAGVGTTWPITPTAVLTGSITNASGFTTAGSGCSTATTIQYLEWNGGRPSGGGGGFLFVPAGTNNLTVRWNYLHGAFGSQYGSHDYDGQIWLDGSTTSARDANVTIQWNKIGAVGDCGASSTTTGIMNLFGGGTNNCQPESRTQPSRWV